LILFTALSSNACSLPDSRVHDIKEQLEIWHGFQQSAVDSAIDASAYPAPRHGPKEVILSSDNTLIEAVKQCSKFTECVFQIG